MLSGETRGKSRLGVETSRGCWTYVADSGSSPRTLRLFLPRATFQVLLALRLGMSAQQSGLSSISRHCYNRLHRDVSTTSSHSLRLLQHDNANFAQSNLSPGWIAREGPSVKCERTKPALQAATPYSYLNATVGFTRVARRAGIKHAVNATSTSRNVTAASASGSTEPILKSTLER